MPIAYSILARRELIAELYNTGEEGIVFDETQPWESLSDAADSPIGPHEIQVGLQLLTAGLNSLAAAAVFAGKIIDLKRKMETTDSVALMDPKTGKTLLKIDKTAPDETIRRAVEKQ